MSELIQIRLQIKKYPLKRGEKYKLNKIKKKPVSLPTSKIPPILKCILNKENDIWDEETRKNSTYFKNYDNKGNFRH